MLAFVLVKQLCCAMYSSLFAELGFFSTLVLIPLCFQLWLSSDLPSSPLTGLLTIPMDSKCFRSTCSFYSVVGVSFQISFIFTVMLR